MSSEVTLSRLNAAGLPQGFKFPYSGAAGSCQPLPGGQTVPSLSATNCFASLSAQPSTATDLLPYAVNVSQWSDGTTIRRWVLMPDGGVAGYTDAGAFTWPDDTTLVQEFSYEQTPGTPSSRRPVETRFLIKNGNGTWGAYTYQWNDAFTDALLVPGGTTVRKTFPRTGDPGLVHVYPSRAECLRCHSTDAGVVLGAQARQLDRNFDYGSVATRQLDLWYDLNLFDRSAPAGLPTGSFSSPFDATQPLTKGVRGYLAANCSSCHRPGGERPTLDLRWETPMTNTGLCGDGGVIVPGDAGASLLRRRMAVRGGDAGQMPPIDSDAVDTAVLGIVDTWINSMTTCQ